MKMPCNKWLPAVLAIAGCAFLSTPREAHAVLVLAATTSTGAQIYAVDQATTEAEAMALIDIPVGYTFVADQSATLGRLVLPGESDIGGLFVDGSTHVSRKGVDGGVSNLLRSSSLEVTNTTGSAISAVVVVGDTDFTPEAFNVQVTGSGTFVDAATAPGSEISLSWKNDPENIQPIEETGVDNYPGNEVATFDFTATAAELSYNFDSGNMSLAEPDLAAFGMSLRFEFALEPSASLISRGQAIFKPVGVIPEPGTIVMALSALPLLGLGYLRNRRRKAG